MKTNRIQFLVAILCAALASEIPALAISTFDRTDEGRIRSNSYNLDFFSEENKKAELQSVSDSKNAEFYLKKKDFSLSLRYFSALKQWQWFGCRGNYLNYERGQAYYGLGQYDQAISDFKHLSSKDLEGQTRLGACYYRLKQYEKAIAVEGSILSKDANCAEARKIRGMAFYRQGQFMDAHADLNKTILMYPEDAEAISIKHSLETSR